MCKESVSQPNSGHSNSLLGKTLRLLPGHDERRLNGMKFAVNSLVPEALPLRFNEVIYVFLLQGTHIRSIMAESIFSSPRRAKLLPIIPTPMETKIPCSHVALGT